MNGRIWRRWGKRGQDKKKDQVVLIRDVRQVRGKRGREEEGRDTFYITCEHGSVVRISSCISTRTSVVHGSLSLYGNGLSRKLVIARH
jgi:hypothetical protein